MLLRTSTSYKFKFAFDIARLAPRFSQIANAVKCYWSLRNHSFGREVTRYLPVTMGIFITFRCNLKCDFCYLNWDAPSMTRDDITLDEYRSILKHPLFRNTLRITFGGGEPLLHPDLLEIIRIAREKSLYTTIYSNGLLLHKCSEALIKARLNSLSISLYEEFADKQIENLRILQEMNEKHKNAMVLSFTKVVSSRDYECMDQVLNSAKENKITNIFFQNYYSMDDSPDSAMCLYDDNLEYLSFLKEMRAKCRAYNLNVLFPNLMRRDGGEESCLSLYSSISLNRRGDISPCCFIVPPSASYGNIFSDPDAWNSAFMMKLRDSFIDEDSPKHPNCANCNLKNIKTIKDIKFF